MSFLRSLHHSNIGQPSDECTSMIKKIVSGGQTGVDRAALDIAIKLGVDHGGWCPKGRKAEDGALAVCYKLIETESDDYSERTKLNIKDSDGTLILVPSTPIKVTDGTILTINEVKDMKKPYLIIDLSDSDEALLSINKWIGENKVETLNVAGPRESQSPGIYDKASSLIEAVLNEKLKRENTMRSGLN